MKDRMQNVKIRQKLKVSYSMLIVLTVVVSVLGLVGMGAINLRLNRLANKTEKASEAIKMCRIDVNVAARSVREMALNSDTSSYPAYRSKIEEKLADLSEELNTLENTGVLTQTQCSDYVNLIEAWEEDALSIVDSIEAGDNEAAIQDILEKCTPALDNLVEEAKELDSIIEASVDNAVLHSQILFVVCVIVVSLITVLSCVFAILICKNIIESIMTPLEQIEYCAQEMAEGNLHVEVNYRSGDELGDLAHSFRKSIRTLCGYIKDLTRAMEEFSKGNFNVQPNVEWKGDFVLIRDAMIKFAEDMTETIQNIRQVAEQVEGGAGQVSATSMDLAEGATEQAGVMQEFTATVETIAQQVTDNAEYAKHISKQVEEVGVEVSGTNEKMQVMVQTMDEIGQSSQKIRSIIDTINSVTAQTSLLALNASIEAARAGEAGKGFAVVASQVSKLATESAEAAKESTALIENSLKEVENGMRITDEIAQLQGKVAADAQAIVGEVNTIAENLQAQDDSFAQLNQGISQINDVIQTNSATSEECAASSQEMSDQATTLEELMERFVLRA
jgi:methyl-accepting chemotaxis protein